MDPTFCPGDHLWHTRLINNIPTEPLIELECCWYCDGQWVHTVTLDSDGNLISQSHVIEVP